MPKMDKRDSVVTKGFIEFTFAKDELAEILSGYIKERGLLPTGTFKPPYVIIKERDLYDIERQDRVTVYFKDA